MDQFTSSRGIPPIQVYYDHVYRPMVEIIHQKDMLRLFPGRTEADLVKWITRNQSRLRQRYDAHELPEAPAQKAADQTRRSPWRRFFSWLRRKVLRWPVYTGEP